jgi:hypothetical protein
VFTTFHNLLIINRAIDNHFVGLNLIPRTNNSPTNLICRLINPLLQPNAHPNQSTTADSRLQPFLMLVGFAWIRPGFSLSAFSLSRFHPPFFASPE